MTVDAVYQLMLFVANKNQAGGISAGDFEKAFNTAQAQLFQDLVGRFQQYQYSRPIPRVGISQNETIVTKLSPFIVRDLALAVSGGTAQKPLPDFIRLLAMRNDLYRVRRVEHDKLYDVLNSAIDPPSAVNNYYVEYNTYWQIYPTTLTTVQIDYLGRPAQVVWAYTLDINGRQVYNPLLSIDPSWDDITCVEIATKAMKLLGIHFKDGDFVNYGNQINAQGE